jgi:hypothetical protein
MTDEQLRALKAELDEVVALRDNLKATQGRCNELLEENRQLKRELAENVVLVNQLLELIKAADA